MARHALTLPEGPYPVPPSVMPGTVGGDVVASADQLYWHDARPDNADIAAQTHEQLLQMLDTFKEDLVKLSDDQKGMLDPYMVSILPKGVVVPPTERSATDWVARSTSPAMKVDILRRHIRSVTQLYDDNKAFIQRQHQSFSDGLIRGIFYGDWVSQGALMPALLAPHTKTYIGDFWSTHLHQRRAYVQQGTDYIVLGQGLGSTRSGRNADFRRKAGTAVFHEDYHLYLGSKMPDHFELVDEAAAEHIDLSLKYGQPEVLDPDARQNDSRVYYYNRKLIAELMYGIDAKLYTRAVTSGDMQSKEWQELENALLQKYGVPNVLDNVCRHKERRLKRLMKDNPGTPFTTLTEIAAGEVRQELVTNPDVVITRPLRYKKPRHVGAAVLKRARN